jgi:integrase
MSETLEAYYRVHFRPTLVGKVSSTELARYDRAVKLIDELAGGELRLRDVNEALLVQFCLRRQWRRTDQYRRQLADCIRAIVRAWRPGALAPAGDQLLTAAPGSLRWLFESVYLPQRLIGCSKVHLSDSRTTLAYLHDHYGRDLPIAELTDALLADHLAWLLSRGLRPVTVNKHRATLCALWKFAHSRGFIDCLPLVPKLKVHVREPDAWSVNQVAAIIAAAGHFQPTRTYDGIPRNLWWRAALLTTWYTALRRSSLLALRRSDVNLQTGWLNVPPEQMKNRRGKKYRLGHDAVAAISAIWIPKRTLLFPSPNAKWLNDHFSRILMLADVPMGPRPNLNKFHAMRRAVATAAAASAGLPTASALLGHSEHQVTLRYIDPAHLRGNDATEYLPTLPELHRADANNQWGPPPRDAGK